MGALEELAVEVLELVAAGQVEEAIPRAVRLARAVGKLAREARAREGLRVLPGGRVG